MISLPIKCFVFLSHSGVIMFIMKCCKVIKIDSMVTQIFNQRQKKSWKFTFFFILFYSFFFSSSLNSQSNMTWKTYIILLIQMCIQFSSWSSFPSSGNHLSIHHKMLWELWIQDETFQRWWVKNLLAAGFNFPICCTSIWNF